MPKHQIEPVDSNLDFIKTEEELLRYWYQDGIVSKYLHKNDQAGKRFSFFDGPITANNPMGVHHGWGRTYKDFWQKYKNLQGFKQRFQNGFDCQGLWVEVEVEKELGFKNKKDIEVYGVANFVQKCKDRVVKFAGVQTEQSKRLGYFMDWDHSYFTMSDANNYMIWHFLKVCHENGWIYKGEESVPWCPRCQTAISQHEMLTEDYKDVVHDSIYLKLPLESQNNENLLIWTTTPWTIPANIAVAVDPKLSYALVEVAGRDRYWVAKDLVENVFPENNKQIIKSVKGRKLVGLKYQAPFDDLSLVKQVAAKNPDTFHRVLATDPMILPVSITEGTGLIHTAVSAGTEDFKLGKKYNLPMIPVIADNADYLPNLDFLAGKNAKKHPEIILDYLKSFDGKWVYQITKYRHRYPACWRCKTELVWKVTPEWYIAMDLPGKASQNQHTLRERMKAVAEKINWLPEFGLDRELDWLSNMHDWLISKKNRYWGLALPIYECPQCHTFEVIGSKAELAGRAVEGWDEFKDKTPHKPFIDLVKIKCAQCGQVVSRTQDVGNVWLDAGIIPFSTLVDLGTGEVSYTSDKKYWQEWFPADFITESFPGQFKNWFYSLIAMTTVLEDRPSFQTVLGYASVLAEDGRPMHKSWGNMIEFNDGANKIGVDIMRWLYLRQNPTSNLFFGYKSAIDVRRRFYLILWNSYRFFINSAGALNYVHQDKVPDTSGNVLDRWIVSRFQSTLAQVTIQLEHFDAFHATNELEAFVDDLSTWFIRRSRDRLAYQNEDKQDQHQCLSVMDYIFTNLSIVLSPFLPFISELMYTNLTGNESVHLSSWPDQMPKLIDQELETNMRLTRTVVERLHSVRQAKQLKVRQPLSAWSLNQKFNQLPNQPELIELINDETNIKAYKPYTAAMAKTWTKSEKSPDGLIVYLNPELTESLIDEGQARDIIRQIQAARKEMDIATNDTVSVTLPKWPASFADYIKKKTLATQLSRGETFKVIKDK